MDAVERLQALHRDLLSLSDTTIPNVAALCAELEDHLDAFRNFVKKPARNDASRNTVQNGTLKIQTAEYTLSEPFKQQALELADALDLDEIEAAALLLGAQQSSEDLDRPQIISAIFTFHQNRHFSLDCLRIVLDRAIEGHVSESVSQVFEKTLSLILQTADGKSISIASYWKQCMENMEELEKWSERVSERIHRVSVTEQTESLEFAEIMQYQRSSISQQHECLGAIAYRLSTRGQIHAESVRWLLSRMRSVERYDAFLVHKLPSLFSCLSHLAASDNMCKPEEAQALNQILTSLRDSDAWTLPVLQSASAIVWLAEYSARASDRASGSAREGTASLAVDEGDANDRNFHEALDHGAFHFLLAVSHDTRRSDWYDPAKQGFYSFLVQDSPALHVDVFTVSDFLREILMEVLQFCAEGLIFNMPDSLRKLKIEEDEQRRQMQGRHQLRPNELELHLERFLLVLSNVFDGYVEAAERFWTGTDSNLHGFLQWASMRQSTPRVAAFCELLRALSGDESTAESAHTFLLDEGQTTAVRSRRNSPLSWAHVFRELEYYASTIRERPTPQTTSGFGTRSHPDMTVEPESSMMLECYLRLISHIASRTAVARNYLLKGPMDIVDNLMQLYASNIPSRLRACAFTAMSGLLSEKDIDLRNNIWTKIDGWIFAQPVASNAQPGRPVQAPSQFANADRLNFERIAPGFEEPNAFVILLKTLIAPVQKQSSLKDSLPFPEDLGARYRMSGIEPYVDFVMGHVFAKKSQELSDVLQLRIMRWECLSFANACISGFNEDLIVLANRSHIPIESTIETSSLAAYARLHPFARIMEWFFNDQVILGLFAAVSQDANEVNSAASDSPLVLSLLSSLEIIDLILTYQRTYFDIIRPLVKTQSNGRPPIVANSALATFEDAIITRLDFIHTLALYCSSGHANLAIAALRLLKQLSESRKLANSVYVRSAHTADKSRLIVALERDNGSEGTCRALANIMQFDPGELADQMDSPGLVIKASILDFIASSLDTVTDQPSVAHLLLGFACSVNTIYADPHSLFGTEQSLFDSIVAFSSVVPDKDDLTYHSALTDIRNKAVQIVRRLWRSPLSSQLVLSELRNAAYDYFFALALRQETIKSTSMWDAVQLRDESFWVKPCAAGYANFLRMRAAFCELGAIELRNADEQRLETYKARIMSSLLGSTTLSSGETFTNASLFDLIDFVDLTAPPPLNFPGHQFFDESLFETCKNEDTDAPVTFDLNGVLQLILLRQNEIVKQSQNLSDADRQNLEEESYQVECWAFANNAEKHVAEARHEALQGWVRLATVVLISSDRNKASSGALFLQLLQVILAKLERSFYEDLTAAEIFAEFAFTLIRFSSLQKPRESNNMTGEETYEKVFEIYRACLSIQSFGDRLLDTLCDDANDGLDSRRASTLLLLEAVVLVSNLTQSKYIIEAFSNRNFVQIMVGLLSRTVEELQQTKPEGKSSITLETTTITKQPSALADKYNSISARIALLARVAQTRLGGALVLSAGLFPAVKEARIFSADPDIGLDFDDSSALRRYYELMLAILRVLNAAVVSQSSENEQTIHQARGFLHENRPCIMSIFKRSAGIGSHDSGNGDVLRELVDNFTALIIATDFMESAEERSASFALPQIFT
ncbi:MAG: hypothetical protein Q9159_007383 [Coniocarpon cinnabarinum]